METLQKLLDRMSNEKKTFVVEIGDTKFDCKKIPFGQLLSIDEGHEVETELGAFERNQEVIYMCCSVFKQALNSVEHHGEPYKIVGKLLKPMEIYEFYANILKQYLGQQDKDVENVKKP